MSNAIVELGKKNALMKVFLGQQPHFYHLPYGDDILENNLSKKKGKEFRKLYGKFNGEIIVFSIKKIA